MKILVVFTTILAITVAASPYHYNEPREKVRPSIHEINSLNKASLHLLKPPLREPIPEITTEKVRPTTPPPPPPAEEKETYIKVEIVREAHATSYQPSILTQLINFLTHGSSATTSHHYVPPQTEPVHTIRVVEQAPETYVAPPALPHTLRILSDSAALTPGYYQPCNCGFCYC